LRGGKKKEGAGEENGWGERELENKKKHFTKKNPLGKKIRGERKKELPSLPNKKRTGRENNIRGVCYPFQGKTTFNGDKKS